MPTPPPTNPQQISLETRGKIGVYDDLGNRIAVVIQRVGRKFGNGRILNDRYQVQVRIEPTERRDAMSGPQLLRRAEFTAAVQAWQGLTEQDRAAWGSYARRQSRTGYNLFIAQHMRQHGTPPTPA